MVLSGALAPWMNAGRTRLRVDLLTSRAWVLPHFKNHFSVSLQLSEDTPAMEALKQQPYPTTPLDTSIFEERSEEYTVGASVRIDKIRPSFDLLAGVVKREQWERAEGIRSELVEMGVPIPHQDVYEKAAKYTLKARDVADRATAFANWFSLYPDLRSSRPRSFKHIRHLLFYASDVPDIPLIIRFGLICASKGYGRNVASTVVPYVVRFAEPSVSAAFLDEFEKEMMRYEPKVGSMSRTYNIVIRAQCLAGRYAESVHMLQVAHARRVRVSSFTYTLLLQKLKLNRDEANVKVLQKLRSMSGHSDAPEMTPITLPTLQSVTPSPIPTTETARLAQTLCALRKSIVSHPRPPLSILTKFILEYRSARPGDQAITLLRRKAFRASPTTRSWWLMAELRYHHRRKQWRRVLITFANYFHLVGVPRERIRGHLDKFWAYRRSQRQRNSENRFPRLLMSPKYPMAAKLWPTPFHTAAVWSATISLSKDRASLESLYEQLLAQASQSQPGSLKSQHLHNATPNPEVLHPTISDRIEAAHFTPFIREFALSSGPQRAAQVLADMRSFGVAPTVYHWTTLAGKFAQVHGEGAKALEILRRMEKASDGSDGGGGGNLPPPNLATYTCILRGFVLAKQVDAARDVERRMMDRIGYVSGSNRRTETALELLRQLERRRGRESTVPQAR